MEEDLLFQLGGLSCDFLPDKGGRLVYRLAQLVAGRAVG